MYPMTYGTPLFRLTFILGHFDKATEMSLLYENKQKKADKGSWRMLLQCFK